MKTPAQKHIPCMSNDRDRSGRFLWMSLAVLPILCVVVCYAGTRPPAHLPVPDQRPVHAMGVDSLFLTVVPDSLILKNPDSQKFYKAVRRGQHLFPNWVNLLNEVVVQGGFQPGASESDQAGGMRVGMSFIQEVGPNTWKPLKDSALVHGWARLSAWKFGRLIGSKANALQKTLDVKGLTHTGVARGLDILQSPGSSTARLLTGEKNLISPKKHNNKMYAELVALKFNIAASQLGKTPVGFGELLFNQPGHPYHGFLITQISAKADTIMTLWRGHPQVEYDSLYSAVYRINRAFVGPIDTISFEVGGKLVLRGAVNIADVPFLQRSSAEPRRLIPTTDITEDEDAAQDDESDFAEGSPEMIHLGPNYPNPFNPSTIIHFHLTEPAEVSVRVFDILGREVAVLLDREEMDEGDQAVEFMAGDIASGMYFCQVRANGLTGWLSGAIETRAVILLR